MYEREPGRGSILLKAYRHRIFRSVHATLDVFGPISYHFYERCVPPTATSNYVGFIIICYFNSPVTIDPLQFELALRRWRDLGRVQVILVAGAVKHHGSSAQVHTHGTLLLIVLACVRAGSRKWYRRHCISRSTCP